MEDIIKSILEDHERRLRIIESRLNGETQSPVKKKVSIREFLDTRELKSWYDKTIAIAYYKEIIENVHPMTNGALESGYQESKESKPKNLSDTIYYNMKRGFLMESQSENGKGRFWEITNTGIVYVEVDLQRKLKN